MSAMIGIIIKAKKPAHNSFGLLLKIVKTERRWCKWKGI